MDLFPPGDHLDHVGRDVNGLHGVDHRGAVDTEDLVLVGHPEHTVVLDPDKGLRPVADRGTEIVVEAKLQGARTQRFVPVDRLCCPEAKVPFAYASGGIAGLLEQAGDGRLIRFDAQWGIRAQNRVNVIHPPGVPTRQHAVTRR